MIASGLKPAESPIKPISGVFTLRSLEDASNIKSHLDAITKKLAESRKPNVVLVGGSFISLELASYFSNKASVTVMGRRPPFESIFGPQVSKKIRILHESKGVKFLIKPDFDLAEYQGSKSGEIEGVKLKDGSNWPADLVVLAIGSQPVTDFLRNSSIKLTPDNYVQVDEFMQTNIPNVYAVGDIAYFPRSCLPGLESSNHVNIAHWGVASSQGRVAAQSIIDSDKSSNSDKHALKVVPFFWSTQYGKSIRFAGLNDGYREILFHEDKTKQDEFKFAAFYLDSSDKCIGVCTMNWDPVCAIFSEALFAGIQVRKHHIDLDPIDIKKLLK